MLKKITTPSNNRCESDEPTQTGRGIAVRIIENL